MKIKIQTVREILRLRERKLSLSEIAKAVGCSKSTVKKYIDRSLAKNAEHRLAAGLSNESLGNILQPKVRKLTGYVEPVWEAAFIAHTQSRVPLTQIWRDYVEAVGEDRALKYSAFCENFKRYTQALPEDLQNGYLALEWMPGEYVQIDYSGDGIPVIDTEGVETTAQIFVAVLPYSSYIFAYATPDQTRASWLDAMVMLFHHLGGTPSYLMLDNTRALVLKASKYNPVLCPEFKTFCQYYNIVADAVNPYRPRQKGAVENAVRLVQTYIIRPLSRFRFFNIEQVNAKLEEMLAEFNARPMKARAGLSRQELCAQEQANFHDLPEREYEMSVKIKTLSVRKDGCIRLGNARYSVPYRYIGKKVEVRIMPRSGEVCIRFVGRTIASHAYRKPTDLTMYRKIEHLTPEQRFVLMSPSEMIAMLAECGPQAERFCKYLHEHLAAPS